MDNKEYKKLNIDDFYWIVYSVGMDGFTMSSEPELEITLKGTRKGSGKAYIDRYELCNQLEELFGEISNRHRIEKVIFHDPATIVFWKDGTKTVVKAGTDEYFDKEKGLAMAISKKVLGNKGNYYNTFKKHGAIDDSGEVFVPLRLLKECTTLRKMKELIAFMEG